MIYMRLTIILLLLYTQAQADDLLFKNGFYSFYSEPGQNSIHITGVKNESILSSTTFYQLLIEPGTHDTLKLNSSAGMPEVKKAGNMTVITWNDSNLYCNRYINVYCNPESEEIKFVIRSVYRKDVQVIRDAIIMEPGQPVQKVFRRNTLMDSQNFQDEYWLNKEGAVFGKAENTFFVYHTPGISSIQLNTLKNQLIINLDFFSDHPFQYFPPRDSMMNEKEDRSCSIFREGEMRENYFSVHAGRPVDFIPRLMLNPDGFLAAHIFTEHADWTDLPTHKAVYFGSSEIAKAKAATGGFIKNHIPVTKSVFYSNPDNVLNNQSRHKSIFSTPIASIRGTEGYLIFLNQLYKAGNEICLHTPDQFTSSRALIEESCKFMKKNFNTVSWIDHGYNNGPKNNREAFVCDGLNPESPYYAKDIWEKYGLRYFWNSYYEDFVTADSLFFDFNGSLMHPYPGFGDAAPAPLYWKNPTRTGNFYSWMTRDLLEMPNPDSWNFHFSPERLNDYVQQRAIKFEHCYPAGSIAGSGYWKENSDQTIFIDPNFEKALERLASYRDQGLINLTTVRDLLDYWIACEHVKFDYTGRTTVKITNENSGEIKGFSCTVNAKKVITEKKIHQKIVDDELIFWFDLQAGESLDLSFSE